MPKAATPCLRLPSAVRQRAEALLDQQMWCWGCDVRHKQGNLLRAYGCVQRPPQGGTSGHSAYSHAPQPGLTVTLWGWGLWLAEDSVGSVFVSRGGFAVRYTTQVVALPCAWSSQDLPPNHAPATPEGHTAALRLLRHACAWVAAYERWHATIQPTPTRAFVLAAWPQRRRFREGVPPTEVPDAWHALADVLASLAHTPC